MQIVWSTQLSIIIQLKETIKIQHISVQNKFWNTNIAVEPKLKLLTNKSETGVLTQTYRPANANMYVVKKAHICFSSLQPYW